MTSFRFRFTVSVAFSAIACSLAASGAAPKVESARNTTEWLRWLIPLPQEVSIEQQVTLPSMDVRITLTDGAGELERSAARNLRALFREKAGIEADVGDGFEILLGVCDPQGRIGELAVPDAARLRELPNREQAYVIRPVGTDRLVLAATDARGVFYAALTMRQLLESKFRGDDVTMPLAVVTDWPDMAERGEWGGSSTRDIQWMAQRKMNLVEFHTQHEVDEGGEPVTAISHAILRRGRLNAVKMLPIISHLNGMGRRGVYQAYPELRGKGKQAEYCSGAVYLHRERDPDWQVRIMNVLPATE